MSVEEKFLPNEILKISPDTIADLTNVALDFYDEKLVSPDNVRKVIDEVLKHGQLGMKNNLGLTRL